MTKIPTRREIFDFHQEVFVKLALNDMLLAADPDGSPVSMPLSRRASSIALYLLSSDSPPAVVAPLTAAQVDNLLEVVNILFLLRAKSGEALSELTRRLAMLDNWVDDNRSVTMTTRDEILDEVKRALDDMITLTEQKVAELIELFDAVCRRRITELDDAIDKLQERRDGDKTWPPLQ
jgi:hypothetical protein